MKKFKLPHERKFFADGNREKHVIFMRQKNYFKYFQIPASSCEGAVEALAVPYPLFGQKLIIY